MDIMKSVFFLIILMLLMHNHFFSQEIRPVRDDVGFCWTAVEMDAVIKYLENNSDYDGDLQNKNLIAGISPHDDYLYAGRIYYPLFKNLRTKEVVIFGVTHGTVRKEMNDPKNVLILDDFDKWQGPYGNVSISPLRELIKKDLTQEYFTVSNKAQTIEHSIEALIPFLQYYNRDIKITPIMITAMTLERMKQISDELTGIITAYMKKENLKAGEDIFFLISNDANHYGEDFNNSPYGLDKQAHTAGTDNDKQIAHKCFDGEISYSRITGIPNELWENPGSQSPVPLWCGRYPIVFGLLTVKNIVEKLKPGNIMGEVLKYSDTFSEGVLPIKGTTLGLTAPFSLKHWVGFLSAEFYLE